MNLYVGNSDESITLLKYMLKNRIKCNVQRVVKKVIVLEIGDEKIIGLQNVFDYFKVKPEPPKRVKPDGFEAAATKWITEKETDEPTLAPVLNFDTKMNDLMSSRKGKNSEEVINKPEEPRVQKKSTAQMKDPDDIMEQRLVNKILDHFEDD